MSALKVEQEQELQELLDDHIEFVSDKQFRSVPEYRWYLRNHKDELPSYISADPEALFTKIGFSWAKLFNAEDEESVLTREYMSLGEARQLMLRLGVKKKAGGLSKLQDYGLLPKEFPKDYVKEYKSQGYQTARDLFDFTSYKKMATYEQMKHIIALFKIGSSTQYTHWYESNHANFDIIIPSNPQSTYTDGRGWVSWDDFLGRPEGTSGQDKMMGFEKARAYMRAQGLTSCGEWDAWKGSGRKPAFIPASPHRAYKNSGWKGMPDFLGYDYEYGNTAKDSIVGYEKARERLAPLELKGRGDYMRWYSSEKPVGLPARPDNKYANYASEGNNVVRIDGERSFDWNHFLSIDPEVEMTELECEASMPINTVSMKAVFVAPSSELIRQMNNIGVGWGH